MTTQIRTTLLTGLFFFGLLNCSQAQDKYDFMMVFVDGGKPVIHIIQNDVPEKIINIDKKLYDDTGGYERMLSTVSQLTTEGWEVITISGVTGRTFYLRKKK